MPRKLIEAEKATAVAMEAIVDTFIARNWTDADDYRFKATIAVAAAIDAIPAAEGWERVRQYNKYGEPVCPHCNQATNRTYAKHRILQCWSCGNYMPELPE